MNTKQNGTNTRSCAKLEKPELRQQEPRELYYHDDEINLLEIWQILARRKKIIFGITIMVMSCAFLYAFLTPKVYEAKATYIPPTESDVQILAIKNVYTLSPIEAYTLFNQNLRNESSQIMFLKEMRLLDKAGSHYGLQKNGNNIVDQFSQDITITSNKKLKNESNYFPSVTISYKGTQPIYLAKIVNDFGKYVEGVTNNIIVTNINSKIKSKIDTLSQDIQLLRKKTRNKRIDEITKLKMADALKRKLIQDKIESLRLKAHSDRIAKISRLEEANRIESEKIQKQIETFRSSAKEKISDTIAKLKEAAKIAHSLGIKDAIDYKLKKISDSMASNSNILTNISSNTPQLFMQGYEYLDAQISSLSIRTNADPFIPKLRSLQDRLNMLKNDEQISALKKRKNDDPFIPELPSLLAELKLLDHNPKIEQLEKRANDDPYIASLRDMESTLAYLKSIHIDPKSFLSARLDKSASTPEHYIKPKRKLIVVLGFILGLMIGVFMAFVMNFRENATKSDS